LFIVPNDVQAWDPRKLEFDKWQTMDIALESAYLVTSILDWRQTTYGSEHPDRFYEKNQIMGRYPSERTINTFFAVRAILHPLITHVLPEKYHIRAIFQSVTLLESADAVRNNYAIGVKIRF